MQFEWVYVVLNTFKRILKWFVFIKSSPCNRLHCLCWWEGMEMLEIFACHTAVHFTNWKWISKIVYYIRYVMVCKIGFAKWNTKIALLGASMVVTYCITFPNRGRQIQWYFNVSSPSVAETKSFILCYFNGRRPSQPVAFLW